jgi:predicted ribosomally synthesized peptide with SipW-like signal peptide
MRKIIKSLFIILAVSAAAGYGTYSFFSDTETSTENTFTAGNIDLTVDSTAHYNGLVCQGGEWVDESGCVETGENLMANGGFEKPIVSKPQKWDIFPDGTTDLDWQVGWESTVTTYNSQTRPTLAQIELHRGVLGAAAEKDQYAELDSDWVGPNNPLNGEPSSVSIHQDIATTAGEKYILKYKFSPRPNTAAAQNKLSVRIDGAEVQMQTGAGGANINWTAYEYPFTADGASTKIEFADTGIPNSFGTFLDDVELFELECTETSVPELVGKPCDETWELTDLGLTHKFFNFDDIKPGDRGENTVSLHVENNNAYACLLIHNVENEENELIDPEEEAGDTSNDEGELAENLNFFAWSDDGDNIWEENEQPLFNPEVGTGEALLDGKVYPLNLPPNPFLAGTTKYIGLAWCAGTMDVDDTDYLITCDGDTVENDAQTDSFTADLTFYVEQERNNPDFACPSLSSLE